DVSSDWRVVHLEHDVGSRLHQFCCVMNAVVLCSLSGDITSFDTVAAGCDRGRNTASIDSSRSGKRAAFIVPRTVGPIWLVVDDIISVRLEVNAYVMRDRGLAWADFHRRDPGVFRNAAWNDHVVPLDHIV